MNRLFTFACIGLITTLGCASGCEYFQGDTQQPGKKQTEQVPDKKKAKKVKVGNNVFLEIEGKKRRVVIQAYVCLREGQLEQLLTRKRTKEHESILAADIDARKIHAALLAAGANPGSPVKFFPKYRPATGTKIKIFLEYKDKKGKVVRIPAQNWIRQIGKKKNLEHDWVFGGSALVKDPFDKTKKPFYSANEGDVICISNFESAMLDLPIASPQGNDALFFEAHTERIPPENTPVTVILEPVPEKKKSK